MKLAMEGGGHDDELSEAGVSVSLCLSHPALRARPAWQSGDRRRGLFGGLICTHSSNHRVTPEVLYRGIVAPSPIRQPPAASVRRRPMPMNAEAAELCPGHRNLIGFF